MGHLGLHNPNDLVFQPDNQNLQVGAPPTGVFGVVIANSGNFGELNVDTLVVNSGATLPTITNLTVENLIVTSGANLPAFNELVVNVGGTSVLGTVISGVWNGTVIDPEYGGTGQSSYAIGDILLADGVTSLTTLSSGVEGSHLAIAGGVLAWVPHTAPLGNVLIGTTPTVNPVNTDKFIMVSGVGLVTVYLPATPLIGQEHHVKDRQGIASLSGITVDGNGGLIDGASSATMNNDYESLSVLWDGAQWNLF